MEEIHDETPLSDEEENLFIDTLMSIMRCMTTYREEEDLRRMNIFSMYILCKEKRRKLVIDKGSTKNGISTYAILELISRTNHHPKFFLVSWVNQTSLHITCRCLVSIKMGSYVD